MNDWLKQLKLCFDKAKDLPVVVSIEALDRFRVEGNRAGPLIPSPGSPMALEWSKSFGKSEWNDRAVYVLSRYYHSRLVGGKCSEKDAKHVDDVTDMDWVVKNIKSKLVKVRSAWLKREDFETHAKQKLTKGRTTTRRHTVRQLVNLSQLKYAHKSLAKQRFNTRKAIVDFFAEEWQSYGIEPSEEESKLWREVKDALSTLGVDGMSQDESDGKDEFGVKRVRRLAQPFLSEEVVHLKRAIDSYAPLVLSIKKKEKQGAQGMRRFVEAVRNDPRSHMIKLPVNWYDKTWLKSLSDIAKDSLRSRKKKKVPHLVRLCS